MWSKHYKIKYVSIRLSHWHKQMVDSVEHLISCHWLAFLSAFSHLQRIQNSAPSTVCWCQYDIQIGKFLLVKDWRNWGGGRGAHFLTYQLILSQPAKGAYYAHHIDTPSPRFSGLCCQFIKLFMNSFCGKQITLEFLEYMIGISFEKTWCLHLLTTFYKQIGIPSIFQGKW